MPTFFLRLSCLRRYFNYFLTSWLCGPKKGVKLSKGRMLLLNVKTNHCYLLKDALCSPSSTAEIAVNTKLKEFATGTATDSSVFCNVKTYKTLPHWFSTNGTKYCKLIIIIEAFIPSGNLVKNKFIKFQPKTKPDSKIHNSNIDNDITSPKVKAGPCQWT